MSKNRIYERGEDWFVTCPYAMGQARRVKGLSENDAQNVMEQEDSPEDK